MDGQRPQPRRIYSLASVRVDETGHMPERITNLCYICGKAEEAFSVLLLIHLHLHDTSLEHLLLVYLEAFYLFTVQSDGADILMLLRSLGCLDDEAFSTPILFTEMNGYLGITRCGHLIEWLE